MGNIGTLAPGKTGDSSSERWDQPPGHGLSQLLEYGGSSTHLHHEERADTCSASVHLSVLICIHSSVQLSIHALTVLAHPHTLLSAGPTPYLLRSPCSSKRETPGQNQGDAQVGLHHRAVLWKESGHMLPSELARVGPPSTHFGL